MSTLLDGNPGDQESETFAIVLLVLIIKKDYNSTFNWYYNDSCELVLSF